ncbi:head completion/stabilization protein [Crenobacter sp. SG2305]|uniref:head completion/stabilization protein n=1 Tax=Crenobacter oryzisoli TaxID=3056844 RepID=UPI0025AA8BD4|nr:head completion/stabilization protein [Crenobacter sp. SG2305]MDN0081603.1 head completion/stabilization protein [Crenobacter sp. SG2305]
MIYPSNSNAQTAPEPVVRNSGFFPDIDPAAVRGAMRIDDTVTAPRLHHAIVEAVATINGQLRDWRQAQQATGFATLDAVPAEQVDGASVQVARYLRAVFSTTKASLAERYRDIDATADGNKRADLLESPIDDLRRDAAWAVRDILGVRRTTVELI